MTAAGSDHIFAGLGFGPIQAGLFVNEAFRSGNFRRIAVAEIDGELVDAVRANGDSCCVNVAGAGGVEVVRIDNVRLFNAARGGDRKAFVRVLSEATEIATCLPSVDCYDSGGAVRAGGLVAEGLEHSKAAATVVYAAENHNRAAEILADSVAGGMRRPLPPTVRFLNTVIGKMSRVITDRDEMERSGLEPVAPGIGRAFLVERYNRILVSRASIEGFKPGIEVFMEKDDLLPFEHAKLYGHNAVHALLGFVGAVRGCRRMTEVAADADLMNTGREAFLRECGAPLVRRHGGLGDELFTEAGFKSYAMDLLARMTNPFLDDTTARVRRDILRKLASGDRVFGTMSMALNYGVEPRGMALAAMAGIALVLADAGANGVPAELRTGDWRTLDATGIERVLKWIWGGRPPEHAGRIVELTAAAKDRLA
jgi:mannitol-1-phosphate 5-dehydrogenase